MIPLLTDLVADTHGVVSVVSPPGFRFYDGAHNHRLTSSNRNVALRVAARELHWCDVTCSTCRIRAAASIDEIDAPQSLIDLFLLSFQEHAADATTADAYTSMHTDIRYDAVRPRGAPIEEWAITACTQIGRRFARHVGWSCLWSDFMPRVTTVATTLSRWHEANYSIAGLALDPYHKLIDVDLDMWLALYKTSEDWEPPRLSRTVETVIRRFIGIED